LKILLQHNLTHIKFNIDIFELWFLELPVAFYARGMNRDYIHVI